MFAATSILFVMSCFLSCTHDSGTSVNEETFVIYLKTEGGGSLSITQVFVEVSPGDTITLAAYADSSTEFDKWTHGQNITPLPNLTDSIISFTARGDDTLTAWFKLKLYTVLISSSDNSYGTVSPEIQQVSHNGSFTVIASVNRGCRFVEWVRDSGIMAVDDRYNDTTSVSSVLSEGKIWAMFDEAKPLTDSSVCVDVNAIGPAGLENGKTWYRAYKSLETAIANHKNPGTQFWLAEGTYTPSGMNPVQPNSNTFFYGGFSSHDSLLLQRNFINNRTILKGNNNPQIFQVNSSVDRVSFNGFILHDVSGACISVEGGENVTVENCILKDRGIFIISNSDNKIKNCVFTGIQGADGCALKLIYCTGIVTVENCIFYGNTTSSHLGIIDVDGFGELHIIHSTIVGNNSTDSCTAAIHKDSGCTVKLVNSILWNNNVAMNPKGTQINLLDTSDNDYIFHCIIQDYDGTGIFSNNLIVGSTFKHVIKQPPVFESVVNPGGSFDEKWFTSQAGLIYGNNLSPGVDEGASNPLLNLNYDIRGTGFNRKVNEYDMGAYELQ